MFTKTKYDSLSRPTIHYSGYDLDETSYADAFSVTDDTILEQMETLFDDGGNAIQTTVRRRDHDAPASETGPSFPSRTEPNPLRDVLLRVAREIDVFHPSISVEVQVVRRLAEADTRIASQVSSWHDLTDDASICRLVGLNAANHDLLQ